MSEDKMNLQEAISTLNSLQEEYLEEMALSRKDAIIKCTGIGQRFVEHFDKIYNAEPNNENVAHWKTELAGFWGQIKDMKLKPDSKFLSFQNLMDWFFTAGQDAEDFFKAEDKNAESEKYDDFIMHLFKNRRADALEAIGSFDW